MFSMIICLPNEMDGLSKMEEKLKSINMEEELNLLYGQTVNVMVPRFKIEKTLDLNDVLMKVIGLLYFYRRCMNFFYKLYFIWFSRKIKIIMHSEHYLS